MVYSTNYQPKYLLDDISNFYKSKILVLEKYYNYWVNTMEEPEHEDLWWLLNDITKFCNNNVPTMYGNYYYQSILSRGFKQKRIDILRMSPIKHQINIWLGLLTIEERDKLIKIIIRYN